MHVHIGASDDRQRGLGIVEPVCGHWQIVQRFGLEQCPHRPATNVAANDHIADLQAGYGVLDGGRLTGGVLGGVRRDDVARVLDELVKICQMMASSQVGVLEIR